MYEYTKNVFEESIDAVKHLMENMGEKADGALEFTENLALKFSEHLQDVPTNCELLLKHSEENIVKPVQKLICQDLMVELKEMQIDCFNAIEYATEHVTNFVLMSDYDFSETSEELKLGKQEAEELTTEFLVQKCNLPAISDEQNQFVPTLDAILEAKEDQETLDTDRKFTICCVPGKNGEGKDTYVTNVCCKKADTQEELINVNNAVIPEPKENQETFADWDIVE